MKYAFPIFQYCRRTIYLLANARRVIRIMKKSGLYAIPNKRRFLFSLRLGLSEIRKWLNDQMYPISSRPTRAKAVPLFSPFLFFFFSLLWRWIRIRVVQYLVVIPISSISIKGRPVPFGEDPLRVRMKKVFVTMAHFNLEPGKLLVPLDAKIPRKCFDFG